jgi:membrane fusion protein (multidrug efflux system)
MRQLLVMPPASFSRKLRGWLVSIVLLCIPAALTCFPSSNWTAWAGEGELQPTDDSYPGPDVTRSRTKAAGMLACLEVSDYRSMKAGGFLVTLCNEDFRAHVDQADTVVRSSESKLVNNQRQNEHQDTRIQQAQTGISSGEPEIPAAPAGIASTAAAQVTSCEAYLARAYVKLSIAELEAQKRQGAVLDSDEPLLRADLNSRRASLALEQTNLSYTRITAPSDGIVSDCKVRPGQRVSPGSQVISLIQSDAWVRAKFKDTQVRHLGSDDAAEIRMDARPGGIFRGRVDHVAPASGSQFALLAPDNATDNFAKIVQRVLVKIAPDQDQPVFNRLRPGLFEIAVVRIKAIAE